MMYSVNITKQADSDLRSIFEYIAFKLESIENANTQLDRLEESILKLKVMPKRFRVFEKEPWASRSLRNMVVDNYIVFYTVDDDNHTVSVIRVMYGGRNIEKQL